MDLELVKEFHPTKNSNKRPEDFTPSSAKKVWWVCSKDSRHIWEARIFSRTKQGGGCPYCKGKRVLPEDSLASLYPELLAEWSIKNKLNPTEMHVKSGKKMWWRCKHGHEWEASVVHRTSGRRDGTGTGCPYCVNQAVCSDNSLATTEPALASEWHPTKNTITPNDVVRASRKSVWWKCNKAPDHEWIASPYERVILGFGCTCCSGHKIVLSTCIVTTHPDVAAEWHPEKNTLTPYNVTYASNKRVWWRCAIDPTHEWQTRVYCRTNGSQCPFCTSSKGEKLIKSYLERNNVNFITQYRMSDCKNERPLPFDFAILNSNNELLGLIEFQGIQHYIIKDFFGGAEYFKIIKRNDSIKVKYCLNNNIKLLIIPYTEINNINESVDAFISSIDGNKLLAI
jgi:hypothetical protein